MRGFPAVILASDIGSTTTKLVAFELEGGVLPATKVRAGTLRPFLAVTMETDRSGT